MLEEFLMPVLEEEGPVSCCYNHIKYLHFHKEVRDFLKIAGFQRNWLAGLGLSLGHFVCLTLLPLIFSFEGT
jgi:hypothetical protein